MEPVIGIDPRTGEWFLASPLPMFSLDDRWEVTE